MTESVVATRSEHHETAARGSRARSDAAVRVGCSVVLTLSLALVTWWWYDGGGVTALGGWVTGLTSFGRLSGLVASVLLLVQVLLMSRAPLLERAFGQDRLAHLHRLIGFTSFNLMVLHIVTITWGYAAGSLAAVPSTAWNLTTTYPGVLLAVAGSVALVMVVVTSVKAARRRLRYESWHLLHLYAYLGVGLALPHQLWTGQDFTASPQRTLFWWTAWIGTATTVVAYRVGQPVLLNLRHRLRVTAVVDEGSRSWSVTMSGRNLDRLQAEPGQFFSWRFLNGPGWTRANPYSLSAAPDGSTLRITVQEAGDGSGSVRDLRVGTRVLVEGPFGRLSQRPRTKAKVAFIGAGVGVTPLRALAEGLEYAPGEATYLERFTQAPLFLSETDRLAAERGLQVIRVGGRRRTADSWLSASVGEGTDVEVLLGWIPDIAERDVYICGPGSWSALVIDTLLAAGLPKFQLHLETFAW